MLIKVDRKLVWTVIKELAKILIKRKVDQEVQQRCEEIKNAVKKPTDSKS